MSNTDHQKALLDLAASLNANQRLLGIDLGSKTIGLALSDGTLSVASPLETLKRAKFKENGAQLLDLIAKHDVGGIIIGLPLNMDGSSGPRVQATHAFARNIKSVSDVPLCYWDERLSTVAVTRTMIDADLSRKRQGEVVDKMAAAYILQGALDFLSHHLD